MPDLRGLFMNSFAKIIMALAVALPTARSAEGPAPLGLFEQHADVGLVQHAGAASFEAATRTFTVTGGGANM